MKKLTEGQMRYICKRCAKDKTGVVMVTDFVLNKYREFTDDYTTLNKPTREKIRRLYLKYNP